MRRTLFMLVALAAIAVPSCKKDDSAAYCKVVADTAATFNAPPVKGISAEDMAKVKSNSDAMAAAAKLRRDAAPESLKPSWETIVGAGENTVKDPAAINAAVAAVTDYQTKTCGIVADLSPIDTGPTTPRATFTSLKN